MAYIPKTQEEEDLLRQQGAPIEVAGTEGAVTPQNVKQSPNQTGMTPFTDVAAYLDANKEQGVGLGQKVAENIRTEGEGARQAVDSVFQTFKSGVDSGTFKPKEEDINQVIADPVSFISDADKAKQFTDTATGVYTGPKKIEELPDFMTAQSSVSKAKQNQSLIDTSEGKQQLISGFQKNPTRGLTAFDAMIFGQNPEAVQTVKDTISSFSNLEDYLAGKAAEAGTYAGQAEADRAAAQELILNKFTGEGGALPQIQSDVDNAVLIRKEALSNLISGLPGSLGDYNWTPEELQALGIDESAVSGLSPYASNLQSQYGVNITPSSYYSQEVIPDYVTAENTITPEQVAKYNALAGLIGQTPDYITEEQRANAPQVPTKIGSLSVGALGENLRNTLSSKDQIVISGWNNARSTLGSALSDANMGMGPQENWLSNWPNVYNELKNVLSNPTIAAAKGDAGKRVLAELENYNNALNALSTTIRNRTRLDMPGTINSGGITFGGGGGYGVI